MQPPLACRRSVPGSVVCWHVVEVLCVVFTGVEVLRAELLKHPSLRVSRGDTMAMAWFFLPGVSDGVLSTRFSRVEFSL